MRPPAQSADQDSPRKETTGDQTVAPASFTPGPWFVEENDKRQWVHDQAGNWVATGYDAINGTGSGASNARLIAAAPELYEALTQCEEYFDNRADVVDGDYGIPEPNKEMRLLSEIRAALAKVQS